MQIPHSIFSTSNKARLPTNNTIKIETHYAIQNEKAKMGIKDKDKQHHN